MKKYITIGQIVGVHGINGEVKVYPLTDDPNRFYDLKKIDLKSNNKIKSYNIEKIRIHKNMVLLKLEGIHNRNDAELLKNKYIEIDRNYAVPLEENEYFISDLLGLTVYDEERKVIGKINNIIQTGGTDIFEINTSEKDLLVPAIEDIFLEINIEERYIVIKLLEGLKDL